MQFITYYEIGNDVTTREILEAGETLMEAGLWPPEGMDLIRWDTTVDNWGITVAEVDEYEQMNRAILMWEAMIPGMFETIKTSPSIPVEDSMEQSRALLDDLSGRE